MAKGDFDHLINNLEKKSLKKSIFNYKYGRRAFLSLGQGNSSDWLETLLPNTRIIIEPKIIGSNLTIFFMFLQLMFVVEIVKIFSTPIFFELFITFFMFLNNGS